MPHQLKGIVMKPKQLSEMETFNKRMSRVSWGTFQDFTTVLLSSIEAEEARDLETLVKQGNWDNVLVYAEDLATTEYRSPAKHRLCLQLANIFRKYPYPEGLLTADPTAKALSNFLASEHKCKRVNQRFAAYSRVRSPHERVLNTARSWISYVLGNLSLSEIWENSRFGAGASVGVHGNATNLARKLLNEVWTVTPGAFVYARAAMKADIHIFELLTEPRDGGRFCLDVDAFNRAFAKKVEVVDYNKIAFVPKTALVDRTIAVEPLLNGYLQKGIDSTLRLRLKRVGLDLADQATNQELARQGSSRHAEPDAWATIDLSSASDSISIELCRFLLPPDWFDIMNSTRSPCYRLNGDSIKYHKFASMGNGFCFPLETLIFASLCHAASVESHQTPEFRVYGDDIIVRRNVFEPLLALLRVCGFKVNPKKTFNTGPFRESCGADWFEGEDVRPVMLDDAFDSLESIFKFCNICRSKEAWQGFFSEALEFLESLIPPTLRFVRPYKGNADSCLEVPWDAFMSSPFSRYKKSLQAWEWVELVHEPVRDNAVRGFARYELALTMGALLGVSSHSPFSERFTTRTKLRRVSYCGGWSITLPGFIPGPLYDGLPRRVNETNHLTTWTCSVGNRDNHK